MSRYHRKHSPSQEKPRKRRVVTVHYLPNGLYQVGFLLYPDAEWPVPGTFGALPYGPVAFDVVTKKIVTFKNYEILGDRLREAPSGAEGENLVQHDYIEGSLYPYWHTAISKKKIEYENSLRRDTFVTNVLSTPDELGEPTDSLQIYQLGSSAPLSTVPAVRFLSGTYTGKTWSTSGDWRTVQKYRYDSGRTLGRFSIVSNIEGKMDGRDESELIVDELDGMDLSPNGVITLPVKFLYNSFPPYSEFQYYETPLRFYAVTPLMDVSGMDDSTLNAQAKALSEQFTVDLNFISKKEPLDGVFYAVQDAVEGFQTLTMNGIAWLKELGELKKLIEPFLKLRKKPFSPKAWANVALAWHYGIRLTYQDDKSLLKALISLKKVAKDLQAYKKNKLHLQTRYGVFSEPGESLARFDARFSAVHARVVATPVYPPQFDSLDILIEDLGFRLNTSNAWDLIPFSFVVDWFTGIGDFFKQVDYLATTINRLSLKHIVYSVRNTAMTKRNAYLKPYGFTGRLRICTYKRSVGFKFPKPPFRLGAPSFLHHWWEGGLLILGIKG